MLDRPTEPVIGLAKGETRGRAMTVRNVLALLRGIAVRKRLPRFVHALAEALDQPQHPRRPAFAIAAHDFRDAALDRIDKFFGLGAHCQDEIIEPLEP